MSNSKFSVLISEGHEVSFSLLDLVHEGMTPECRKRLAESLVCADDLFDAFVGLIVHSVTEEWGHYPDDRKVEAGRLRIMESLDPIRYEIVKDVLEREALAKSNERRMEKWAWAQYHARIDGKAAPSIPDFVDWDSLRHEAREEVERLLGPAPKDAR